MNGLQTLSDLAVLARAGFKASDILNIISEGKENNQQAQEPAENVSKGDTQPEPEKAATEVANVDDVAEPESEYKQKYDDAEARIKELEETLKKAQALNISQTVTGSTTKTSDADVINNAFRNLL